MLEKAIVERQCQIANRARRVEEGFVTAAAFFQKIEGDLLITGKHSSDTKLLLEMAGVYQKDQTIPTIFLSSHEESLEAIYMMDNMTVADHRTKQYHPLYGISAKQLNDILAKAAEHWGYTSAMDKVLLYVSAVIDVMEAHYEVSLPALHHLLLWKDEVIAALASECGIPVEIVDNIKGNKRAGLIVRKIVNQLFETFENITEPEAETEISLASIGRGGKLHLAVYQYSTEQEIFNLCIREELKSVLRHFKKLRIITNELMTEGEDDPLLRWLKKMKQTGRIQWILCSENAGTMLEEKNLNFSNICIFRHNTDASMEWISEHTFGRYEHHYPVQTVGQPPNVFFTFKRDEHWTTNRENRLRVRAEDLEGSILWMNHSPEKMAVKISRKDTVFLVPVHTFLNNKELSLRN